MYLVTDATLATVDFAKGSMEDVVVNCSPSRDAARLPMYLQSPL